MGDGVKKHKILIAEDNPAIRRLLQGFLEEDYQLVSVANGREAVEAARNEPHLDLILLDIIMPEVDGYEACQQIREELGMRDVPIIFLTVLENEHDEIKGFAVGVTDYIVKPVSRLRLKARIKNQLQLKVQQQFLKRKNQELRTALDQIKTLRGILPICSFCKQIKDQHGNWQKIEEYIHSNTEADFSHSVCPQCMKDNYPEYDIDPEGQ